jgi:hypothetical protein
VIDRNEQNAFLKAMMAYDDAEARHELHERMVKAESELRCVRRALGLVMVVSMLALAGYGYCAVLVPNFFHNSSHVATRLFAVLGLGSVLAMVVFAGLWLYHRGLLRQVQREAQSRIASHMRAKFTLFPAPPAPPTAVIVQHPANALSGNGTGTASSGDKIVELPKAV